MVSGDVFLTDAEDGKRVVTESKHHKEIKDLFVDGKVYFNVKLAKKEKEDIAQKAKRYRSTIEDLKKEKDQNKQPKLLINLIKTQQPMPVINPFFMNFYNKPMGPVS